MSGDRACVGAAGFGHQRFNQLNHLVERTGRVGLVWNLDSELVFNLKQELNHSQRVQSQAFERGTGLQLFFSDTECFGKKIDQIRIHQNKTIKSNLKMNGIAPLGTLA